MVKYYDISRWEEHPYYGTGGTRNKTVVENPEDGCLYYFKTSLKKKKIDYKYEFWSEIIASEIGGTLGLNVLHYNVAWKDNVLGCLSKSMIDSQKQELQEGYKWLTGFDAEYDINNKEEYTFQTIERLLTTRFKNENFIKNLIEIIIFDSIIGNEDRHQENWSVIVMNKVVDKKTLVRRQKPITQPTYAFAPIYDSGSSMGRELTDAKVSQMLKDSVQLEAYVNRGRSEIHWEGENGKQKHLDLIRKVSCSGYNDVVMEIISSIRAKYDANIVFDIINTIDECLPEEYSQLKIPQTRKDFLIKLVSLRINKLFALRL